MRVETERMYLYPLSDEGSSKSNHRMGIVTGRCKAGGGGNRCGKYSLTESPFPDRLYKKWKDGRRGTKICIRR